MNGTTGTIFFSTEAELLYRGFEDQIRSFLQTHSGIGLVIVDTLAKVREGASRRNAYAEDYTTMTVLKNLAQQFHLVLLVVHHDKPRQRARSNPREVFFLGGFAVSRALDQPYQ